VSAPDEAVVAALLRHGGHPLDGDRTAAIAAAQAVLWPALEALRAVPLPLVDAVEPGHALARLHGHP
jgi:hypothetical protein